MDEGLMSLLLEDKRRPWCNLILGDCRLAQTEVSHCRVHFVEFCNNLKPEFLNRALHDIKMEAGGSSIKSREWAKFAGVT
jgi:hypothetical protein